MWVTMTEDGPEIANIALKGIFDRKGLDPELFGAYDRKGAGSSRDEGEKEQVMKHRNATPLRRSVAPYCWRQRWHAGSDCSGPVELSEQQLENIVRRSYQYVAMYNVNNKFALKQGGWNTVEADTRAQRSHDAGDRTTQQRHALYQVPCWICARIP